MENVQPLTIAVDDLVAESAAQLVVMAGGWKTVSLVDEPLQWIESNLQWIFKAIVLGLIVHLVLLATLGWFGYSYYQAYTFTTIPALFPGV